jgi:hypothetical protein
MFCNPAQIFCRYSISEIGIDVMMNFILFQNRRCLQICYLHCNTLFLTSINEVIRLVVPNVLSIWIVKSVVILPVISVSRPAILDSESVAF